METALAMPIGSTRQFDGEYLDPSVPANVTLKRIQPHNADSWCIISLAVPTPQLYDFQKGSRVRQEWDALKRELERIAKLRRDWDGEGAEPVSKESIDTALALIKMAQEVMCKVEDQNEPFLYQSSIFIQELSPELRSRTTSGLLNNPWDAIVTRIIPEPIPGLYPTVEGGVTLKWIHRGKELQCTAQGDIVEVIRWKSTDAYDSDGLWDLNVEQIREHIEWLMR
jgi:hypothetical protein